MTLRIDPLNPAPEAPGREPWERPEIRDYDVAEATQASLGGSNFDTVGYS